ncbi:hypothetical protein FJ419_29055 [Mesorhizobium sp. B2-6-2]|nr:hypothetical protein FJ419_29055 [Mesorhizobium sp. B2-6-2]
MGCRRRRASWTAASKERSAGQRPPLPYRASPPLGTHLGGDQPSSRLSPIAHVTGLSGAPKPPISPLVGEMSGRTEGGAKDRDARRTVHPKPPSSTRP